MSDEMIVQPPRSPRWMRILLGVSLALNLAVLGLAAGIALRILGPGGPPAPPGSLGGVIYRVLSPEDRRALSHDVRDQLAPRRDRREDAHRLAAALRADPYDSEATRALIEEQAAARLGWQAALQSSWLKLVEGMAKEDRRAYADRLETAAQNRRGHHDELKGEGPGH